MLKRLLRRPLRRLSPPTRPASCLARRLRPKPDDHVILPEIISKEPLGPAVRHGDDRFADIVNWSQFAMIEAEEYGLTSKNIDEKLKSENPSIQRFVGATGHRQDARPRQQVGLNIVKQVGNYGESFDPNPGSPLGRARPEQLWNQGGLMYAPPIR